MQLSQYPVIYQKATKRWLYKKHLFGLPLGGPVKDKYRGPSGPGPSYLSSTPPRYRLSAWMLCVQAAQGLCSLNYAAVR